jgi:hypothetical protein
MAQIRVNGSAASDQFLSGDLSFFWVDAGTDISDFGFHANGEPKDGEVASQLLQSVANLVILDADADDANILYVATEVGGVSAGVLETALQGQFASANVQQGVFAVAL